MSAASQVLSSVVPKSTISPFQYRDQRHLRPDSGKNLVCFEKAFSLQESNSYFHSSYEALRFRDTAIRSLGFPTSRPRPCKIGEARVLFLRRPEHLPRPLWNHDDLVEILRKHGVSKLKEASITEDTPYMEQASLFHWADIVISVHGSQLGNFMFMPEGGSVIEIFPHSYFSYQPYSLGLHLNINHERLMDNALPPRALVESRRPEFLDSIDKALELDKLYPTAAKCLKVSECR